MTTLTIEIPEKVERTLSDLIEQLGGKVLETDSKGDINKEKLSRKEKEFLRGFEESIEYINMHKQGKVKARTIDQLLNKL